MNVFNEWHAANTSKKIRAVLEAKQRSGVYTSWKYPYGYRASNDENRTAIIDEEAAKVVRRIFELRAEGYSVRKIAKILTDEKIPNPTNHFQRLDGGKWSRSCNIYWCPQTIARVLSNPVYIGRVIQHKTTAVSYKNHKIINIPKAEQIVKENAHEAIVSYELWDRAQQMKEGISRGKVDKSDNVHALSGLLICADCGKKLKLKGYNRQKYRFYCRTYADLGKNYCSSHSICEREIESVVLLDVQNMIGQIEVDEKKARESFFKERAKSGALNGRSDEERLKVKRNRLAEIEKLLAAALEDRVLKNMPENLFINLCEKYRREQTTVEGEIAALEKRSSEAINIEADADEYVKRLKSYARCEVLTREACLNLINFITVGEKNEDGNREIHIYYNLI